MLVLISTIVAAGYTYNLVKNNKANEATLLPVIAVLGLIGIFF